MIFQQFFLNHFRYSLFGIVYLTAAFFNITVGLIVLLKDQKNPVNRSFFYITSTAFIWSLSIGMIDLSPTKEQAHFWLRSQYFFGVPFISPTVYLFSSRWVGKKANIGTYIGFGCAFAAMIAYSFFPDSVWTLNDRPWGRYPSYILTTYGITCISFLLTYFFIYAFMAFGNMFRGWRNAEHPKERAQFRNLLIGFVLAYVGAADFVAAFDVNIIPFGFVPLTTLMLIIAYTMLKHEFLDVNLLFKKGFLVLLIYSALLAVVLPAGIPIAMKISHDSLSHPLSTILGFGVLVGIILSFGPVIYTYVARKNFWLRETMSTGLAHELKSPLGAIQGALELISTQLNSASLEKNRTIEYVELIQKNADRLENYVKDLLNLARIEKGEVSIDKTRTDFPRLVQDVVNRFEPIATQKNIPIKIQVFDIPTIFIDPSKIEQVVSNLLSNAIRYSDKGAITVSIDRQQEKVRCSIADQGRGIESKNLSRVFDSFFQESKNSKGSGIGLTIAKAWVEAHGGKIWAESSGEGQGTRMVFTLSI